jgi:hypothetical protein
MEAANSNDMGLTLQKRAMQLASLERTSQKLRLIQKGYHRPQHYFIPKRQFEQEGNLREQLVIAVEKPLPRPFDLGVFQTS